MFNEAEWEKVRVQRDSRIAVVQSGAVRIALLFGSVAIAFALLLAPVLEKQERLAGIGTPLGVDRVTTGSINPLDSNGIYTLHRSVLQKTPRSVCVIHLNGVRTGDC